MFTVAGTETNVIIDAVEEKHNTQFEICYVIRRMSLMSGVDFQRWFIYLISAVCYSCTIRITTTTCGTLLTASKGFVVRLKNNRIRSYSRLQ